MRRVLPSDVVRTIDTQLPWATREWRRAAQTRANFRPYGVQLVSGILKLIEQIPEELLTVRSDDYVRFISAKAALEEAVTRARNLGDFEWPMTIDQDDCLVIIKEALQLCPDEAPSSSVGELAFVQDGELRRTLLIDLGSAETALSNGEWKACTVLCGSITEALLLWAIGGHSQTEIAAAIQRAVTSESVRNRLPPDDLTHRDWNLHGYIEVAAELQEIEGVSYRQCQNAKDYRNLIHPAVAARRGIACDKGSSHTAIGTVYSLITRLEQNHQPSSL